jgi:hypothetical protein
VKFKDIQKEVDREELMLKQHYGAEDCPAEALEPSLRLASDPEAA